MVYIISMYLWPQTFRDESVALYKKCNSVCLNSHGLTKDSHCLKVYNWKIEDCLCFLMLNLDSETILQSDRNI